MKKLFVITFIALVFSLSVFGQSDDAIEKELVAHIKNIREWSSYTNKYDETLSEKLDKENKIFKKKLLKFTKQISTLQYKFSELAGYLFIATSPDGKYRIYSWDTQSGGTMHFYENVFQYQGKSGKVFSEGDKLDEGDAGGFYSEIYELDTNAGKIYLTRFHAILSSALSLQSMDFDEIKDDSLNTDIKLIETETGLESSVSIEYNFFSVVDRKERPIKLILYDGSTQSLRIPVVVEDANFPDGKVTDKFIVYKFNGKHFVKTK